MLAETAPAAVVVFRNLSGDEVLEVEILAYLTEHPHAMDTVGGIAAWWLDRHHVRGDEALSRTLGRLVDLGILEMIGGQHEPLYRLRDSSKRPQR